MNTQARTLAAITAASENLSQSADRFERQCETTLTVKAMNDGANPQDIVLQVVPSGDPGLYHEIAVSALTKEGKCIADVLIGIDDAGNVRVMTTSGGNGDGDKNVAVYPELDAVSACSVM